MVRSAATPVGGAGKLPPPRADPKLGQLQLLIVGAFRKQAVEEEGVVRDILNETGVKLFTLARIAELTHKIRTTGKPVTAQ